MPTIENHAEHAFHLPPQSSPTVGIDSYGKPVKDGPLMATPAIYQDALLFPRAGKADDDGNPVPSLTNVTDEQLARMKAHPVARGWFKPAGGRLQLRVAEKAADDSAPEADTTALGSAGGNKGKPKA